MSTMDARARNVASIKWLDPEFGRDFEYALTALAFLRGPSWFTDDQIADLRHLMVGREWKRRCRDRQFRAAQAVQS